MSENSWATQRPMTSPFAQPRGLRGRLAGRFMAATNGRSSRDVAALVPLRPGQTVLEVGYGPGVLLAALAERPERPRLLGVEPSPEMAGLATRRAPTATLRSGTAAATGLADASVDHAVSVNTVAIWPDLDAGLDELCRVVRPGGSILLAWHSATARSRISRTLGLSETLLARIADGLAARCGSVERMTLRDVVVFRAVRSTEQAGSTSPRRAAEATRMQAVVQDEYGEAEDVLRVAEIDRPAIGRHEVLVRVHAAGVDRGVWHLMTGLAYPIRLAGYGVRAPRTRVRGREVAGTVEAVGADAGILQPGDRVYGIAEGAFAEYAVARADLLAPMPANLGFTEAAAVPVSAQTALQAVRAHGRLRPGQTVLVIGASGGVGTFAVQIAKAFGARVTGVASAAKLDLVRSLGADHVLDYTREEITDGGRRYDLVVDTGGHRSLTRLRRALTPRGTLVIVGSETGGRWTGGLERQLRLLLLAPFVRQSLRTFVTAESSDDLAFLTTLIEAGEITPAVDRTYPLRETPAAIRHVRDGRARGKVVVAVR